MFDIKRIVKKKLHRSSITALLTNISVNRSGKYLSAKSNVADTTY